MKIRIVSGGSFAARNLGARAHLLVPSAQAVGGQQRGKRVHRLGGATVTLLPQRSEHGSATGPSVGAYGTAP